MSFTFLELSGNLKMELISDDYLAICWECV